MGFFTKRLSTKTLAQELESRGCSCDISSGSNVYSLGLPFGQFTKKSAMGLSAWFSATNLISNSIGILPIYEKQLKENAKSIVESSAIAALFYSTRLTKFNLMKKIVIDVIMKGNAFIYIKRNGQGLPVKLVYLQPGKVSIQYNDLEDKLTYLVSSTKDVKKVVQPEDMLHFLMYSNDGVNGLSVYNYAQRAVNLANSTESSAKEFFDSGCQIKGMLKLKNPLVSDKQRNEIRQNWAQVHSGDSSSGLAVLSGVEEFTPVSTDPDKSQLIETRQYNTAEIARFFNISPVLLGDLSHTSYGDVEQASIDFVLHCIIPWVNMIENEINRKLIAEKTHYIDLDENTLLRSNKTNQANYIKTLVSGGVMTANEARNILDLNPMSGADRLIVAYSKINDNTINTNGKDNDKEENGQQ